MQKVLRGNRRAAGRVRRLGFKWKLPVGGWAGLRRAPWVRPCCTAGTALGDASGGCHAVRNVRAEARVRFPAAGVAGVPGSGPGRGVVHVVGLNGAVTRRRHAPARDANAAKFRVRVTIPLFVWSVMVRDGAGCLIARREGDFSGRKTTCCRVGSSR